MSISILDSTGSRALSSLRQDEGSEVYRIFQVKNTDSVNLENVKVALKEAGLGAADASYLKSRSAVSLAYTRLSSGMAEQQYLGVGPVSVETEDPEELESLLLNGRLQLSADTFRWGSLIQIGTLEPNQLVELYARYVAPAYVTPQIMQFNIRNIGTDTFNSVVASVVSPDQISLDGINYSSSVNLGDMPPTALKTIWLKSYKIDPALQFPSLIKVYSASALKASLPFDMLGAGRAYCSIPNVKDYLTSINVDAVSTDEEILDLIHKSANEIDRATRRRFDAVTVTELYDGSGQQKLVLDNYPIISVQRVRVYNYNNQPIRDITSESDLIVQKEFGFITLPPAVYWLTPEASFYHWPHTAYDYFNKFGKGVANIEVTYTYGYQVPPPAIRDACMKMVVIELLKKKGAGETQGVSQVGIVGMTETFTQPARGGGSGPFGQLIGELQADINAAIERSLSKPLRVI